MANRPVQTETYFCDYDGDYDVDNTDLGYASGACAGSDPEGACRVLDPDCNRIVNATDEALIDGMKTDLARHPDRTTSGVDFPFGHQGLYYDAELESCQNRSRQYSPSQMRFMQRDSLVFGACSSGGYQDGMSLYTYAAANPVANVDPSGHIIIEPAIGRNSCHDSCTVQYGTHTFTQPCTQNCDVFSVCVVQAHCNVLYNDFGRIVGVEGSCTGYCIPYLPILVLGLVWM